MNIRRSCAGLGRPSRPSGRLGEDTDEARVPPPLELHVAVDVREEGVVVAAADVEARLEPRPALPDENAAAGHELAAEALDPEHLGIRIATVAGAANAFLVRHVASDLDVGDANRGHRLPMAAMTAVVLAPLELHDHDLARARLADDLALHERRLQRLGARHDVAAVARHHEDRAELDEPALVTGQLLNGDDL